MIEERATVSSVDGDFATVTTQRESSCGTCAARGACGTSALSRLLGTRRSELRVLNPIGARPGDEVVIGLDESAFTRTALAFYLVPLLGLIGAAAAGKWLALAAGFASGEPAAIGGGVAGLLAGLIWLRRHARRIARDPRRQAVILRHTHTVSIIQRSLAT